MTEPTAREAMEMAQRALNRIDKHEAECVQRWANTNDTMKRIEDTLNDLRSRWVQILIGLVAAGFGSAAVLLIMMVRA